MKATVKLLMAAGLAGVLAMSVAAAAQEIHAKLDGYQVDSSQNTTGTGTFKAKIDRVNRTITYTLTFENLRGDILQSHIHFGRPGTNGGIVLFLCAHPPIAPPPPATAPACSGRSGTVENTSTVSDIVYLPFGAGGQFPTGYKINNPGTAGETVVAVPGTQGIDTSDPDAAFDEVVRAIDAGAGYIVVHTSSTAPNKGQPAGELRGNIPGRGEREEHEHQD